MFAPPPKANRIILNSVNFKVQVEFYEELGMLFNEAILKNGLKTFTYIYDDFHFEIHEVKLEDNASKNVELRFLIDEIEGYLEGIRQLNIQIIKNVWNSKNHQHILLKDIDGNLIELMTKK